MSHAALHRAAAVTLLLLIWGCLAIAQTTPQRPPDASARILLTHRINASPDADGLLVQALAGAAELTRQGKSIGDAMRMAFGSAADNDWLRNCVLTNWRIVNDFGLITPENLQRMHAGEMPIATVGTYAGKAMAVISEPDTNLPPNSSGVTYRLVPAPLQKAMANQATEQGLADRLAARNAQSRLDSDRAAAAQRDARAAATPRPPNPPVPPNNWTVGYPKNRISSGAAPKIQAPGGAGDDPRQKPIYFDVKLEEAVNIGVFGPFGHLSLNKVDHTNGIDFAIVDPSKTVWRDEQLSNGTTFRTYHTNALYYHSAWTEGTIPGANEKGVHLITLSGVRFYLAAFEPAQNTFRVVACAYPLPDGASDSPPPTPITDTKKWVK